jgi:hypothetical protein
MNTPLNSSPPAALAQPKAAITLAQALQQARTDLAQLQPPAAVQASVLAALPLTAPPKPAWLEERVLGWIVAGGRVRTARMAALALSIGALAGISALLLSQAAQSGAHMAADQWQAATAFVPLVSAEGR